LVVTCAASGHPGERQPGHLTVTWSARIVSCRSGLHPRPRARLRTHPGVWGRRRLRPYARDANQWPLPRDTFVTRTHGSLSHAVSPMHWSPRRHVGPAPLVSGAVVTDPLSAMGMVGSPPRTARPAARRTCRQGAKNRKIAPGVIKQLKTDGDAEALVVLRERRSCRTMTKRCPAR
jgi:hypothetical protein